MIKNVVLTGMMGVGKTTIGKNLAEKLSFSFLDTDKIIEEEFVYLCNKPGEKCYYTIPCKILRDSCNDVNGKIFKVPLSRAVQMKREKCECQEGIGN